MDQESRSTETPVWVAIASLVGLAAALTGFIEGIVLMAKRAPGRCFVASGNFPCRVHPRVPEGLALAAISLSVGAVVLLLFYVSVALSRGAKAA